MNDSPLFAQDDAHDGPSYHWLDEWLCEYVDGTMDPSLRAVFDEYLDANPALAEHVERLRRTRDLLCACGQKPAAECRATQATRDRVCGQVEYDLLRAPRSLIEAAHEHPTFVAAYASSVLLALVVGLWAGATLWADAPTAPRHSAASPDASGAVAASRAAARTAKAPPAVAASPFAPPEAAAASAFWPLAALTPAAGDARPAASRPASAAPAPADSLAPPRAPAAAPRTAPAVLHAAHRAP